MYLSGLLALAIATTFLYIGDSLTILLIGRAAQGVSSAVICTVGISFIVDKAPVDQLGSALGIVGMSIATAIVVGPIIGGFAYRYAGYHTVFAISYVLLAIDILLSLLMIEDQGSTTNAETKDRDEYTPRNPHGSDSDNLCIFPELEEGSPDSRILTSRDSSPKSYKTRMYNCLPGIVWLLASPRILVCVAACFLNAALLTSFDSVSTHGLEPRRSKDYLAMSKYRCLGYTVVHCRNLQLELRPARADLSDPLWRILLRAIDR